ncbi:hypothetical protein SO802_015677 [Lithocarpus litseifolius]|uniref:Uncharacterized protein n=1 Tax=Lithocarpus litseifolius TaxID=425828 RepID=A0AAW2CZN8_9ROSI
MQVGFFFCPTNPAYDEIAMRRDYSVRIEELTSVCAAGRDRNVKLSPSCLGSLATSSTSREEQKVDVNPADSTYSAEWDNHGWFYMLVRVALFLWVWN